MKQRFAILFLLAGMVTLPVALSAAGVADSVERYCVDCHNADDRKGGLDLESLLDDEVPAHTATWETVIRRLSAREMPPPKRKKPPDEATINQMLGVLVHELDAAA